MPDPTLETIDFRCPDCGQLLRSSEADAGTERACAVCGTVTKVPQTSEAIEASTVHSGLRVPEPSRPSEEGQSATDEDGDALRAELRNLTPAQRRTRQEDLLRRLTARTRLFIPLWIYSTFVAIVLLIGCSMLFRGILMPNELPTDPKVLFPFSPTQVLGAYWTATALHIIVAVVLLVGIVSLQRMQFWWIAVTGVIVGMLPLQFCFPFTFPAAAWLLWLLMRPEIREAFRSEEQPPLPRSENPSSGS